MAPFSMTSEHVLRLNQEMILPPSKSTRLVNFLFAAAAANNGVSSREKFPRDILALAEVCAL